MKSFLDAMTTPAFTIGTPSPLNGEKAGMRGEETKSKTRKRRPEKTPIRPVHLVKQAVLTAVHAAFGVSVDKILGRDGTMELDWARHNAFALTYEFSGAGLVAVGRAFGRDHTTILHSVQRLRDVESKATYAIVHQGRVVRASLLATFSPQRGEGRDEG